MNEIVKCPNCDDVLIEYEKIFKCNQNHSFDKAKQGYVNLLQSSKKKESHHGDSKEMMLARIDVLWNNHYDVILKALVDEVSKLPKNINILDAGSGVGYYVSNLRNELMENNYIGIDIAKQGVLESAKKDKHVTWIVGSTATLPITGNSVDVIISIFSPYTVSECERVLKDNGIMIVISPNEFHLQELKEEVYPTILKRNYEKNVLESKSLVLNHSKDIKKTVSFKQEYLKSLLMMTPHFWRVTKEAKDKLYDLSSLDVTIDVVMNVYKKESL